MANTTIRKPTQSEFKERTSVVAVRDTAAATSALAGGTLSTIFSFFLAWIGITNLIIGLEFFAALAEFDTEQMFYSGINLAIGAVATSLFVMRRKRKLEESRTRQLGAAAAASASPPGPSAPGTDHLSAPLADRVASIAARIDSVEAQHAYDAQPGATGSPGRLPSRLEYSRQALAAKLAPMGFVSVILGLMSFGDIVPLMVISGYFAIRSVILLISVGKPLEALKTTPQKVTVSDLLGNTVTIAWRDVISMERVKLSYWDVLSPALLGSRHVVMIRGTDEEGKLVRARIPFKLLGITDEDVFAVIDQAARTDRAAAPVQSAPVQTPQTPAQQPTRRQPLRGAIADLEEVRATYAEQSPQAGSHAPPQTAPVRAGGFGRKGL